MALGGACPFETLNPVEVFLVRIRWIVDVDEDFVERHFTSVAPSHPHCPIPKRLLGVVPLIPQHLHPKDADGSDEGGQRSTLLRESGKDVENGRFAHYCIMPLPRGSAPRATTDPAEAT